jgi:hypothetical protein
VVTNSKFRNGKIIRRTEQEQVELDRLKAECGILEGDAGKPKLVKTKEPRFIQTTIPQFLKLRQTESFACVMIYPVLQYQWWCRGDKSFVLPTEFLLRDGFSRITQRRALIQLETVGLISVERKHRNLPRITVLGQRSRKV